MNKQTFTLALSGQTVRALVNRLCSVRHWWLRRAERSMYANNSASTTTNSNFWKNKVKGLQMKF